MDRQGYFYQHGGYTLRILPYSDKIIRISYGEEKKFSSHSYIVTAEPPCGQIGYEEEYDTEYTIRTGSLTVRIKKENLSIQYERADGMPLSLESSVQERELKPYDMYRTFGGSTAERVTVDGVKSSMEGGKKEFLRSAYHAKLSFTFSEQETVFGFGNHEEGYSQIRGQLIPLYQENMRIALPYFVSSKGYAYLFDCTSFMTFDDREGKGSLYLDSVDVIDYYFIAGDNFDEVCRGYRYLTGSTPMLPKWAVGYAQSKERYTCADELLKTVTEYRKRGVPLDVIVQDWQYWKENAWGEKIFDSSRYPEPEKLTAELHRMGAHMMVSVWPNMSGDSENRREFEAAGKLLADGTVYDAFDEGARNLYWKQANEGIFQYGTDAWWCDSTEPFDAVWQGETRPELAERMKLSVDEFKKYMDDSLVNVYSLVHSMGIYEGQRRTNDKKRVLNLTRSGYAGQHRYGTVVWSGDVHASWETLRRQISIMQNYIACGEAYWNSDIGAFFVRKKHQWFWCGEYEDGCKDDAYRELYTRWLQFAGFTPMMRSHGTDTPREIWNFGEKGTKYYDAIEKAIRLRYALIPYFYSVHAAVTLEGTMPVRPLALAFPEDLDSHSATEEYMYGHEFLVCPVTKPMQDAGERMRIYLPKGGWYDFYTEEYYEGGCFIETELSIDRIPVFVRAGSIIPMTEVMQYVDEKPDAPYEIVIYCGADGEFVLYDDSGDGYGYENGRYVKTNIRYNGSTGVVEKMTEGKKEYQHKVAYRMVGKKDR